MFPSRFTHNSFNFHLDNFIADLDEHNADSNLLQTQQPSSSALRQSQPIPIPETRLGHERLASLQNMHLPQAPRISPASGFSPGRRFSSTSLTAATNVVGVMARSLLILDRFNTPSHHSISPINISARQQARNNMHLSSEQLTLSEVDITATGHEGVIQTRSSRSTLGALLQNASNSPESTLARLSTRFSNTNSVNHSFQSSVSSNGWGQVPGAPVMHTIDQFSSNGSIGSPHFERSFESQSGSLENSLGLNNVSRRAVVSGIQESVLFSPENTQESQTENAVLPMYADLVPSTEIRSRRSRTTAVSWGPAEMAQRLDGNERRAFAEWIHADSPEFFYSILHRSQIEFSSFLQGRPRPLVKAVQAWMSVGQESNEVLPEATPWQAIEEQYGDACNSFSIFLDRLRSTSEYQTDSTRPFLEQRVRQLLNFVQNEGNGDFREQCFDMAVDAVETCGDRIALRLNDMECGVLIYQAEHGLLTSKELLNLGKQHFHLQVLQQFAKIKSNEIAERLGENDFSEALEVELALRYKLGNDPAMNLPRGPTGMLYEHLLGLQSQDYAQARDFILTEAADQSKLFTFLNDWKPWIIQLSTAIKN